MLDSPALADTPTEVLMLTNKEFADNLGIAQATASRIRSGDRLPSVDLLARMVKRYRLDPKAALAAAGRGGESFGRYLERQVFQ